MGRFSLSAAVPQAKRASDGGDGGPAPKKRFPRASDLVVEDARPQRQAAASRRPETAPVICCVYEYSKKAGDAWSHFQGTDAVLYQIQRRAQWSRTTKAIVLISNMARSSMFLLEN
jgi:hypothetical protein